MSLWARLEVTAGTLRLDVEIEVAAGEVVAVVGPNAAGKTTMLHCLAGLRAVDGGRISIDDEVVDDPAAGVFVPPEQRSVGVVFQDYLLFDHLSVLENVAFGLRAGRRAKVGRLSRAAARAEAYEWLERMDLADRAGHRPASLSGGQRQRVALARALATKPRLLLLDEPLAALDAGSRGEVRRELRRQLASFDGMRLLVTHDPVDAYALADRVVVLENGRVTQSGTLGEVGAHPRSRYVADLVGVNLVSGEVRGGVLHTATGAVVTVTDAPDGTTLAVIRPQAVTLHREPPAGSARNTWRGVVTDVDYLGDRVRVRLGGQLPMTAEVTVAAMEALAVRPGDEIWAAAKATDIATTLA